MNCTELVTLAADDVFKARVKLVAYKRAISVRIAGTPANAQDAARAILTDRVNIGQIALAVVTHDAIIARPDPASVTDADITAAVAAVVPAYL